MPLLKSSSQDEAARPREIDRIIEELQAGVHREKNFQLLFQRYYRLVRRFLRQRGCTLAQSEDLTQETFLHVSRGLATFRRETRFENWLFHIAGNVYRHEIRRTKSEKRAVEVSLEGTGASTELVMTSDALRLGPPGALRQLLGKERVQVLRQTLDELPPQMRQCVCLRFDQELRYREIAEVLQISMDAVKVQLFRARKLLRSKLGDHFDGFEL